MTGAGLSKRTWGRAWPPLMWLRRHVAGIGDTGGAAGEPGVARSAPLLALILLAALVLRVATAILLPSVAHPDETFQYLEQANRLAGGRGLVPWEFVYGARSWIIPGLLWPLAALSHAISRAPELYTGLVAAVMICASLTSVASAYVLGRAHGRVSAALAGLITAIWPENVFFAPHVLADTLSAASLIGALALCVRPGRRRAVVAGLLFGITVALRIQLAPAVVVAATWALTSRFWRDKFVFGLALAVPFLASGVVDWITWGAPFYSTVVNFAANAGGVADSFGVAPWYYYPGVEISMWGLAAPLVLGTALLGARRAPLLGAVVAIVMLTFTAVPHKEYRFIYPALPILCCLCGIGAAHLLADLRRFARGRNSERIGLAAAVAVWAAAAGSVALSKPMIDLWTHDRAILQAFAAVNADPASCGLAIAPPVFWSSTGQSRLRSDVTLYIAGALWDPGDSAAYNYFVQPSAPDGTEVHLPGFRFVRCYGDEDACLYRRGGGCNPDAADPVELGLIPETEAALKRLHDQGLPWAWARPLRPFYPIPPTKGLLVPKAAAE